MQHTRLEYVTFPDSNTKMTFRERWQKLSRSWVYRSRPVAQLLRRWAVNSKVAGSSLSMDRHPFWSSPAQKTNDTPTAALGLIFKVSFPKKWPTRPKCFHSCVCGSTIKAEVFMCGAHRFSSAFLLLILKEADVLHLPIASHHNQW